MGDQITICVPCELRFRNVTADLVRQYCERRELLGATPEQCMQVHSAFIEAFNNVALHGISQRSEQRETLQVDLAHQGGKLVIQMRDRGKSFDFEGVEDPDLSGLPESGIGIFIIKRFMTQVEYSPGQDGGDNVLRMVKELHANAGPLDEGSGSRTLDYA